MPPLLLTHLAGAALTGLAVIIAIVMIIVRHRQTYAPLAITLSMLTGWQLISGALLTLTAVEPPTLFAYCRNVVTYLAVISAALLLISRQMKLAGLVWPTRPVGAPLSVGALSAVILGIIIYT